MQLMSFGIYQKCSKAAEELFPVMFPGNEGSMRSEKYRNSKTEKLKILLNPFDDKRNDIT